MNIGCLIVLLLLFLSSCSKNNTAELWAAEEANLLEWIKENHPDAVHLSGIYFVKTGASYPDNINPEMNDNVLVDFICRFWDDDAVEMVSHAGWWPRDAQNPSMFREGGPELWAHDRWGRMGIGFLNVNEQAYVYVPSRLLDLQDFRTRVYHFHLRNVISPDILAYQHELMGNFMTENFNEAVDTITITENGKDYHVMYHVRSQGAGLEITQPLTVKNISYEYYFLEDEDFRSCFPRSSSQDAANPDVVKTGFNGNTSNYTSQLSSVFVNNPSKNNKPLHHGGRIVVVMPYRIMYGDNLTKDHNGQYIAPASSVLKYEITIDN